MPFKSPHVSLVSFSLEVGRIGVTDVMVIETDLHLNARHAQYNAKAVSDLIEAARNYLGTDVNDVATIRLVSNRSNQL